MSSGRLRTLGSFLPMAVGFSTRLRPLGSRNEGAKIKELEMALEQIAICCTDNMDRSCDHRMALDFVRQVANTAFSNSRGDRA